MIVAVIIKLNCTDLQIDVLVYELYGLTEEEIKIVEEGGGRSGLWPRISRAQMCAYNRKPLHMKFF
jgi:hypothetical protein